MATAEECIDPGSRALADFLRRYTGDLVTGLHLVGSAADGDFRPGQSDLDFVALLSRRATDADLDALAIVQRAYASDPTLPRLDGIWLTAAELAAGPDAIGPGPTSDDNSFHAVGTGNRNPVTWMSLPTSRPVFGDLPPHWQDRGRLVGWVRDNAAGYWTGWHRDASRLWTPRGIAMLGRAMPMWGVLGISRLAYTAATGEIASKSAAGEWALATHGKKPILQEALAFRGGRPAIIANPRRRRREALAYVGTMIAEIIG